MSSPSLGFLDRDERLQAADRLQAEYFKGVLEAQRDQVEAEIAEHSQSLAMNERHDDTWGAKREGRIIRALEREKRTVLLLIEAIEHRFRSLETN
jgi:hypothetical protein